MPPTDAAAVAADPASRSDVEAYGLLRVDGVAVALPLSALREVVTCPAELTALPVQAEGLVGALELRRLVVPVVDLRLRPGAAADGASRVVVVVTVEDHLIGVLADRVDGIARVASADLLPMRADRRLLFSATFRSPEGSGIVSVLDAEALLSLPGVPSVEDRSRAAQLDAAAAGAGETGAGRVVGRTASTRTLTLLRCGPHLLGLDVEHVHTMLPTAAAGPSVLSGGVCIGTLPYEGRDVAVVDPLAVLGLGGLAPEQARAGLVLDVGAGFVTLAVSELLDLPQIDTDDVLPLPPFAAERDDLFLGLVDLLQGCCLVVDGAALRSAAELVALGGLNTALDPGAAPAHPSAPASSAAAPGAASVSGSVSASGAVSVDRPHLAYAAGTELVTPLEQVAEILPMPTALTRTGADPALLGVVLHRRVAVPVLCLATLLGLPTRPDGPSTLLLVAGDGGPVGLAVEALRSIVHVVWQDACRQQRPAPTTTSQCLSASPLVETSGSSSLLPVLDLRALAALAQRRPRAGLG